MPLRAEDNQATCEEKREGREQASLYSVHISTRIPSATAMDGSYVLPTTPQLQRKLSHSPASTPTPASPVLATLNLAKPPALSRREQILQAVEEKDVDTLRKMAAEQGGFENSELRQLVW